MWSKIHAFNPGVFRTAVEETVMADCEGAFADRYKHCDTYYNEKKIKNF